LIEDVRWTLKEAAYKSLPSYLPAQRLGWKSLDVRYLPNGAPTLHLIKGNAINNDNADGSDLRVDFMASLSGDAGVLVGVVVALRKG